MTKAGEQKILDLFQKYYQVIEDYCIARGKIVHNNYTLEFEKQNNQIRINCFTFNLSTEKDNDKKIKQHIFVVNNKELRKILLSVFHLINDYIEIMKNPDTIDFEKLKKKFTSTDGKSIKVSF